MKEIGTCIHVSYDSFEAARIVAVLQDAGIPSYVKEDGAGNIVRLYSGHSSTAHRIFVPEQAEGKAKGILQEMGIEDRQ